MTMIDSTLMFKRYLRISLGSHIVLLLLSFFSLGLHAEEWARGIGEYSYGDNMATNIACSHAEQGAIKDAIRKVLGEKIIASDNLNCAYNDNECEYMQNVITISMANILGVKDIKRQFSSYVGGKICRIELKAKIAPIVEDVNFDFTLKPNSKVFQHGDKISVEMMHATQDMNFYVFNYINNPSGYGSSSMRLIDQGKIKKGEKKSILNENSKIYHCDYFPQEEKSKYDCPEKSKNTYVEVIKVIGVDENIKFAEEYSYLKFNKKIYELQNSHKFRTQDLHYQVSRIN